MLGNEAGKLTRRVIDAHLHLSSRRDDALVRFAEMNGLAYNLEELLDTMRRFKIKGGLLLSPPLNDGTILPNEEIIKLCSRSKGMLKPVITVEPSRSEVTEAIKPDKKNSDLVRASKVRLED